MRSPKPIRKVTAGDRSVYPFNHPFTEQEKKVFDLVAALRIMTATLKTELAKTPKNACSPPKNYDPRLLEEISGIEQSLDSLDLHLRWIPGGAYRYESSNAERETRR